MENTYVKKLTKSQEKMIQDLATVVDGKYYYIPYWFEKTDNGYNLWHLDKMPKKIVDRIWEMRND